jgi:hypothetical protein
MDKISNSENTSGTLPELAYTTKVSNDIPHPQVLEPGMFEISDVSPVQPPNQMENMGVSNNSLRVQVAELWDSVKEDYKNGDRRQKTLIASAALFQVWNQSQLQRVVSIPLAVSTYKATGNEWVAGTVFAGLNYTQQFGISGTTGMAAREFPATLEKLTDSFPAVQKSAEKIAGEEGARYTKTLLRQSSAGQALGSTPYVLAEVLANPKGSTKKTVLNAEKVSRRIGVASGAIGVGVLKAAKEYPTNDTVQRVVGHAQNPLVWMAVGALTYLPSTIIGTAKAISQKFGKKDGK